MSIAGQVSWEMWNFPETHYDGPFADNGWSCTTKKVLRERLAHLLRTYPEVKRVITHNVFGEYGHVDHRNLHKAVRTTLQEVYGENAFRTVAFEVFSPRLKACIFTAAFSVFIRCNAFRSFVLNNVANLSFALAKLVPASSMSLSKYIFKSSIFNFL